MLIVFLNCQTSKLSWSDGAPLGRSAPGHLKVAPFGAILRPRGSYSGALRHYMGYFLLIFVMRYFYIFEFLDQYMPQILV